MYTDGLSWSRDKIMSSLCLMVLLAQLIVIVDSSKSSNPSINRQMCTKLQSMLSFGKYQTSQMSSNITYVPRIYAQNFLAYSSMDDLLIFIEPKHQIHVYNAQTVQLIVNLSTTDVVIATSCTSLVSESRHDLYFIYATQSTTNLIALRVCQVHFNVYKLSFDSNYCIETIKLQYDQPNLRIYGFTIKRDHAGTKKSLLFISTEIGLIYVIFETHTGVLFKEPVILNETLNEGSVVLSLSNSIYYASKQEHIIYELRITADFRLYYGNITKTKAIKSPFGLITDECNHLYIATRSMILIMYVQSSVTIRSVFSKSSDLPITLERLNATTYVYATIKKQSTKLQPHWMFNFLYFTEPEKVLPVTRHPVIELEDDLDINLAAIDHSNIPTLWPLSYSLLSTTNITKKYTQFASTPRKPFARLKKKKSKTTSTSVPLNREGSSTVKNNLLTEQPIGEQSTSDAPDDSHPADLDDDLDNTQFDLPEQMNQTLEQENPSDTDSAQDTESESDSFPENQIDPSIPIHDLQDHSEKKENLTVSHDSQLTSSSTSQPLHPYGTSNPLNTTRNPKHPQLSRTNSSHNFEGNENQPFFDNEQLYHYLAKHPISESKSLNGTNYIEGTSFTNDNLRAYFGDRTNLSKTQITEIQTYLTEQLSSDQNIFSKYLTSTRKPKTPQLPGTNVESQVQGEENHALHEDTQIEDRSDELLPLDPTYFNRTTGSEQVVFTVDDLRAYLQGTGNLSTSQQTQIQAYLDKQSASNQPIFSKHSTTTKPPSRISPPEDNLPDRYPNEDTMLDDLLQNVPLVDSRYFNFSTGSEQILIAKDEVQSYLEGRGNLTKTQIEQIHAYFAQQSSPSPSDQNISSRYRTSTTDSTRPPLYDTNKPYQLSRKENQSLSEDQEAEMLLEEVLALDPTYFNPTEDAEKVPFTVDDLRAYLQGRGNLSASQQTQIQMYLDKQSASNQPIFSKHSTTTKPPSGMFPHEDNLPDRHQNEDTMLDDLLKNVPLVDSRYFNFSTGSEQILIAKEDVQSYLEGRGNLSKTQIEQIHAYFAQQSSSSPSPDPTISSRYRTSTADSTRPTLFDTNTPYPLPRKENQSLSEDQEAEKLLEEVLALDPTYFNPTKDAEKVPFTIDDLRAYLHGRGDVSPDQQAQIEAYLTRQSSSNQNIFSKHSTSTKPSTTISLSDDNRHHDHHTEDTKLEEFLNKIPLTDSKYFNFSTNEEVILIAKEDLQSYLQGEGTLSKTQEAQIQAYLAKQSSPDPNPFSKYVTTTRKPGGVLVTGSNISSRFTNVSNDTVTEDRHSNNHVEAVLPYDLDYLNHTTNWEERLFTADDLQAYLQGRGNLSTSQQTQIQAYLDKQIPSNQIIFSKHFTTTKPPSRISPPEDNVPDRHQNEDTMLDDLLKNVPLVDSRYFNFSTGSEQILIAKDDVQSYLEGRGNLSKTQIEQIHAYFAQQSSSSPSPDQNIPSQYRTSTTDSTRPTLSDTSIPSQLPRKENQSLSEDQEAEKLLEEVLALDPTYFNPMKDAEKVPFAVDDLRGYLHGRGDLSPDQQAQIEAYLTRQSSSNQSTFSKYSTSTKAPTGVDPSDDDRHRDHHTEDTKLDEFLNKIPLIDSKYFNFSSNTEEILISKDDLMLHLQGRGNLSKIQKAQIQAYFAAQSSSSDQDTLSEYLTSTRKSQTSPSSGVNVESQKADGHSSTENPQPEDESKELLPLDLNYFNNTKEAEKVLFTVDDLRTYLRGEGNLSLPQQAQIETYLARQASTNQSVFSKLIKSTTLPTSIHTSNNNTVDNYKVERAKLMDLINKLPLIDSKYLNLSANSEQGLISKDDLLSYLQGRGNLSKIQETQIEAYLFAQSSSDQNIFAQYRTSTTMPRRPLVSGTDVESPFEKEGNHSLVDDTQREEQAAELLPIDSTYFNHTEGLEKILFTVDDLRAYLKGEGNLTLPQQVQIEAYLTRQASANQSIFSKSVKSTTSPTTKLVSDTNMDHAYPNVDAQLKDLLKKIPLVDSNYFNFSTNAEEKLISKDDLVSYLQGRGNLSKIQESQIEAYLVAQSSSDQNIFSQHRTSTAKPRRPLLPGTDIESQFQREGNYSLNEDVPTEDQFQELLPLDPTYFNHSKDAEKVLFTIDDLQAYLKGGANLSSAQQAQIQGYLTRQSSSNQSIFSKYSTNTKPSTTISLSDENVRHGHPTQNTKLDDFLNKIPLIDSKYFNFSTNTEEILISKDDLLLHLQGRGNLSTIQKAQIQAYFAAQPSSTDQDTLSEYLTSTTKSRTSLSPGVNVESESQTARNNSHTEDTLPEDKFNELLPLDPTYFNNTKHAEKILFTVDDLQTYLKGEGNLSLPQQAQIKTYLARQASANQSIYSKYIESTQPPTTTVRPSDDDTDQDDQNEQRKLEELLETIPLVDSKYFHFSTNTEEILIPREDLLSHLQGRRNLSKIQETQIQAYLASQPSADQNLLSQYLTSTRKPRTTPLPDVNVDSQSQIEEEDPTSEDAPPEDGSEELVPLDVTYFNRTTEVEKVLFTVDDLRDYLYGRGNLTPEQQAQIEAYLTRQASLNQSIFSKQIKSTTPPTSVYGSDDNTDDDYHIEDGKLMDLINKIPLIDSKYLNFSTNTEQSLVSKDDLLSYLQGRGNLSKIQETQIETYLAAQSPDDQNIFAQYRASIKKRRKPLMPGTDTESQFRRKGNYSLNEQMATENQFEELLPLDVTHFNHTKGSEKLLFTVDDLRAYLQGRGNLSPEQQAQIQAYLAKQAASNQSIFFKHTRSTKPPRRLYSSNDSIHDDSLSEDRNLENFLERIRPIDSTYSNSSTESEKTSIAVDDLRSYLHGKGNLSKSQELLIQTYFTKNESLGNNTFNISNTTLSPAYRSRLWSQLFHSPAYSSTRSPTVTRFSSSKFVSEVDANTKTSLHSELNSDDPDMTPIPPYSSDSPSFSGASRLPHQSTSATITSDMPKGKLLSTHSHISRSSTVITRRPSSGSSMSSAPSRSPKKQSSKRPETRIESSSPSYVKTSGIFSPNDQSTSTTLLPRNDLHSPSTSTLEKTSIHSVITSSKKEGLRSSDYASLGTTEKLPLPFTLPPWSTHSYKDGLVSDRSSFQWTSTIFPPFYKPKPLSPENEPVFDLHQPLSTTTTTARRYRTRKQKIIRWQTSQSSITSSSSSSTTTTITPSYPTTAIHVNQSTTSTQLSLWHSQWHPLEQQQMFIIKPSSPKNGSNILLSNDYLNDLFNNISTSTNASEDKLIYFNLLDLPPSSWNFSLKSNESITLDIALPSPFSSSNSSTTTNLTFTNIEANRFSTNIIGQPIRLHVDRVHAKQFSLKMNTTNDDIHSDRRIQHLSDVIIGHVTSEQFQLNLTKSDKMHVHVQQVDSATAELYLDGSFCTNDSSLEINLNLSKNGTIRYGNRTPIHIGPVFTRVHMLKQSCDREQPLSLFFDICEQQNPCSNNGSCVSVMPDYTDTSYLPSETGHIGYECSCPRHTSGEHCQHSDYPLGYCLNGGTLFRIYDRDDKLVEKCICSVGFQGEYCEENIDNCIGIDCSGRGVCDDGIDTYTCSCFDGFYGSHCERTRVQTILLQAASRSFGIIAILLIAAIAGLVVASDIHTYLTRKHQKNSVLNKLPRITSEMFENSVLLLGFGDAPIEMNDLSNVRMMQKPRRVRKQQRQTKRTTRIRKTAGYRQVTKKRPVATLSSGRQPISKQPHSTLL